MKTCQERSPLTPQDTQDYELCSLSAVITKKTLGDSDPDPADAKYFMEKK